MSITQIILPEQDTAIQIVELYMSFELSESGTPGKAGGLIC